MEENGSNFVIKVDTQVLRSKARLVEEKAKQLRAHLEAMETSVKNSSGYWIGEAGDLHRSVYPGALSKTEWLAAGFQENAEHLLLMAGNYEEEERQSMEEAEGLPTDVIL